MIKLLGVVAALLAVLSYYFYNRTYGTFLQVLLSNFFGFLGFNAFAKYAFASF